MFKAKYYISTKKINISTFENYLNASEVSKITIINKTLAEVTLTDNALLNEVHRDVSKSNFLGQRNTYGPHYSFEVGDLELFQRRLEDAESKGILFNYEFKTVESKWLDVLIGFLPLIILIGLWIFFMSPINIINGRNPINTSSPLLSTVLYS